VSVADDIVAPFSLDGAPVRGRIARLSAGSLDPILRRHAYPRPVAMLLGEALTLAALMAALIKEEGRLIVQAQGDGPVSLLAAEHAAGGHLRGYARLAEGAATQLTGAARLPPRALIGAGAFVMTFDRGDESPPHQGVVSLEGDTLAACAENYFLESEQVETRIRLAVGEAYAAGAAPVWRGGGALMQRVAGDAARGDPEEDWRRAALLFETVTDAELIDPDLPADRLLYRLFHEEGARMAAPSPLIDRCSCDEGRLTAVLSRLEAEELAELVEPDGLLHARCQFCAREYRIAPGAARGGR
jgi:molecular chaperone Hsp33